MDDSTSTHRDHYDLVELIVDGTPVEFTAAWITQETAWTGPADRRVPVRSWHGQIVSDSYEATRSPVHSFTGRSIGHRVTGFFYIFRSHSRGVDFDGRGTLTVT